MSSQNDKSSSIWNKIKYWFGYCLFIIAIIFGVSKAPVGLLDIRPIWLLFAVLVALTMFMLQGIQVLIFLRYHNVNTNILYPALFTARKGVLNTILPAKSGTLILLTMLTRNYQLKWYNFVVFILVSSVASLIISLVGLVWLLLPIEYTFIFLLFVISSVYYSLRKGLFAYSRCMPSLLLIALGLFIATIFSFFCMLRGLGFQLSFVEISYFAIALNALAQFSITPGNVGVREVVVGMMAPYLSLPVSVGILASAGFFIIRMLTYSVILVYLEWLSRRRPEI